MGNKTTKSSLKNAIVRLSISAEPIEFNDDKFWSQIWTEEAPSAIEIIKSISTQEIRMFRDQLPRNFAILIYKMVERLNIATGTLCNTQSQQTAVLNATRILTRLIPCIFEDKAWRNFFSENYLLSNDKELDKEPELKFPEKGNDEKNYRSYLPTGTQTKVSSSDETDDELPNDLIETNEYLLESPLLDHQVEMNLDDIVERSSKKQLINILVLSICDLLFCPEFTVSSLTDNHLNKAIDAPPEDLRSLPSCDYVWEPGVGFESSTNSTTNYDKSRSELLRLLLVSLSSILYEKPSNSINYKNRWIEIFASTDNRHALPLFTSLLNVIFIYKPKTLLPFNHLLFENTREELVELSIQILIATLDYDFNECAGDHINERKNLFIDYMSRIHRSEDFSFIVKGFVRLLNNRFEQGYLINSTRPIGFEQELLILFWKICNLNNKIIHYMLKSRDILDIVVPTLYHLNENFQDTTKTAIIHIGIFNLLILSGERNFAVMLNKPYQLNVLSNLPSFQGSHADLMFIVFHKLILYGQNLHQLFDFMLTILVNISPYLKSLTMLACKCLLQLFEIFSSACVIFTEPSYHQLVVKLLEIFNNLIQYQFDGNANLVYLIISKREAFISLSNLPTSANGIQKVLNKLIKKRNQQFYLAERTSTEQSDPKESSRGGVDTTNQMGQITEFPNRNKATVSSDSLISKPHLLMTGKLEVSLVATPDIGNMTKPIHLLDGSEAQRTEEAPSRSSSAAPRQPFNLDDLLVGSSVNEDEPPKVVTPTASSSNSLGGGENVLLLDEEAASLIGDTTPKQISPAVTEKDLKTCCSASAMAPKKWKPTPEWVKEWKKSLPLHTTLRMIEVLTGQIERIKSSQSNPHDEMTEIIKFLQNGTLVGLLPVPHPIQIRKYYTNNETTIWFRACTWGIIYVRNADNWTDTQIKLIKIE